MLNLFISVLENPDDEKDFTRIYYEYEQLVLKVTFKILGDQYYAEDAAQEAWFGIAKNYRNIDCKNQHMLKGYIIKAAKNSAYNVLKKKEKHDTLELKNYFDVEYSLDEKIASNEQYARIKEAILNLPEVYRDVLTLHFLFEMRATKIAKILNCSESTIRSNIRRGKKIIARLFEGVESNG